MPPLKGIPPILPADLLWALSAMGHGDEIVITDINFPSCSTAHAHGHKWIDMSGHSAVAVLDAILTLFPLDQYVEKPACVMSIVDSDVKKGFKVPIWDTFHASLDKAHGGKVQWEEIERFAFYERSQKAFAVVGTGERAQYANIILKKGIVPEGQ